MPVVPPETTLSLQYGTVKWVAQLILFFADLLDMVCSPLDCAGSASSALRPIVTAKRFAGVWHEVNLVQTSSNEQDTTTHI